MNIADIFANIFANIDFALVIACLGIMAKGMVGIFTVILAIWGLVALLNKFTSDKE